MNLKNVMTKCLDKSNLILSGASVIGMGLSCYLFVRADRKAREEENTKDKLKHYILPGVVSLVTGGGIIGNAILNEKRADKLTKQLAAATAAVIGTKKMMDDYREVVKEEIGEEREAELVKKVCSSEPGIHEGEPMLHFYDETLCEEFDATLSSVLDAHSMVNRMIRFQGDVRVSEYRDLLGLETDISDARRNSEDSYTWNEYYGEIWYGWFWVDFYIPEEAIEIDGKETYVIKCLSSPIAVADIEEEEKMWSQPK